MIQKSYDGSPSLYIVPTPIGNLEDITLRAIRILKEVDIIFAEDTRTTQVLLNHYEIKTKLKSNHKYNEEYMQEKEIKYLKEGKNIAIVSDAGTPVISDPGFILVKRAIEAEYNVICLPGPTAIIPAVVMSGLAGGPFTYYGFLNNKQSKRRAELESLKDNKYPVVFYEAPHRLIKTLTDINEILENRKISIVREISKRYEEVIRDNVENVIKNVENIKGEIVIVVEGKNKETYDFPIIEHIQKYIDEGMNTKEAIKKVSKQRKLPKNVVYQEFIQRG